MNYERASQLSPHDAGLMLRLAGTYIYQQDFDKAVATLQKAVVLQPDSPEIHLLLGLSLSQLNPPRTQDAIAEWRSVVTLAPDFDLGRPKLQSTSATHNSSARLPTTGAALQELCKPPLQQLYARLLHIARQ